MHPAIDGLSSGRAYTHQMRGVRADGSELEGYRPVSAVPGAK